MIRQGLRSIMARIERRSADRYTELATDWLHGTPTLFAALTEVVEQFGIDAEGKSLIDSKPACAQEDDQ